MKTQVQQIGKSGSFINQVMGNNSSEPVLREWATIMHYTDRSVGRVIKVSKDGKSCVIRHYNAKAIGRNNQMGHQNWEFYASARTSKLRWRNKAWRIVNEQIVFTDEYIKDAESRGFFSLAKSLTEDQRQEIYQGDHRPQKVVKGITKKIITYNKISIVFGVCNYYYDWSF